jgi:perosamine synthetase
VKRGLNDLKAKSVSEVKIPMAKPVFSEEMEKAAVDALWNEHFVLGESVKKFEEEFAKYCGTDFAVSMSSGTDALRIALIALGIRPGGQVITTPASFVASSNVVLHASGTPIFADIDLGTYTIDPDEIKKAVIGKTRGIIPVHLYGHPADMDSINKIARSRKLCVIEDSCQAHGALYKGRKTGGLGDAGCFSFYPTKNMTVGGDGGIMVTNDAKVAEKCAKLRNCGRKSWNVHDVVGYTSRLNTVNAAIGRIQLKHLDEWNANRIQNAETYDRLLADIEEVTLPPRGRNGTSPVYHLYVIRTKRRDSLGQFLESNGIQCGVYYPFPIHLQPIYRKMFGYKRGMFPLSEELCSTCLSLPMFPELSKEEISFVSEKIHDFFER